MRKRVINHVADTIFWYILYFLPVLAYLFFVVSAPFRSINEKEGISSNDYNVQTVATIPAGTTIYNLANPSVSLTGLSFVILNGAQLGFADYFPMFAVDTRSADSSSRNYEAPCLRFEMNDASAASYTLLEDCRFLVPSDVTLPSTGFILFQGKHTTAGSMINCLRINANIVTYSSYYISNNLVKPLSYDFSNFVNDMGFEFATDNIIVNSLADIFGTGGIMPMFDNDTPFIIFAWFIGVYLLHLLVDFLLFIPRIAHKWMKDCTGGD